MTQPQHDEANSVSIEPTELDLDEGGKDPDAYEPGLGGDGPAIDDQEGGAG